jgi:hypothetical protein
MGDFSRSTISSQAAFKVENDRLVPCKVEEIAKSEILPRWYNDRSKPAEMFQWASKEHPFGNPHVMRKMIDDVQVSTRANASVLLQLICERVLQSTR